VYDYAAGEQDWFAYGLPREGESADTPWAGDSARGDVPTCAPTERLGAVRDRVRSAGWDACVVINAERGVLGLLRDDALGGDPSAPVEAVMEEGPSTFRPSVPVEEIADFLEKSDLPSAPITTPDGRLVGLFVRA
jgi:CBS domain-containing protein